MTKWVKAMKSHTKILLFIKTEKYVERLADTSDSHAVLRAAAKSLPYASRQTATPACRPLLCRSYAKAMQAGIIYNTVGSNYCWIKMIIISFKKCMFSNYLVNSIPPPYQIKI